LKLSQNKKYFNSIQFIKFKINTNLQIKAIAKLKKIDYLSLNNTLNIIIINKVKCLIIKLKLDRVKNLQ